MANVLQAVLPLYEKEMSANEERVVGNIISLLDKNQVTDVVVRSRILAKNKAFIRDLFNAGVENGVL